MGYRSEGKLIVDAKAYALVCIEIGKPSILDEFEEELDHPDGFVVFSYTGFKMYESYPDVAALYKFLERLDYLSDTQESDVYDYIRVGEEEGDIVRCGTLGILSTCTTIEEYW